MSHPAKRRRDDAARGTTHKRRKHTSHDTETCALCARPERKKNEVTSSAKWEGRLFEFSGRRFHEQCLLWSSGLDVSEDTATSLVVVDPSPLLLACCPLSDPVIISCQIEPGDERTRGRPDVSDEDVQDLLIESSDRLCSRCKEPGASVGCDVRSCKRVFHFLCARRVRCAFHPAVRSTPRVLCPRHIEDDPSVQHNQRPQKKASPRVPTPGGAAAAAAVEYEWVKIDGEFKRVPKKTKAGPAPALAAAPAAAPAAAAAPPQAETKKFVEASETAKSLSMKPSGATKPPAKAGQEAAPDEDNGGEPLLPAVLRASCRAAIRDILNSGRAQQDGGNGDAVDLTSSREEDVSLDTAALRLEVALYVAFPFPEANGDEAAATANSVTVPGKRISYPAAAASMQQLLRQQSAARPVSAEASLASDNADGLLAQVLGGKVCAEQLGPLIADAVAGAAAAPAAVVKEDEA